MLPIELKPVIEAFNARTATAEALVFVTRDTALQEEAAADLKDLRTLVDAARGAQAEAGNEDAANFLLGLVCGVDALISELNAYLLIKAGDPERAWDALVTAQVAIGAAMRAHWDFGYLEKKANHLRELERYLFGPQSFMSAGMIVRRQECSICGHDYSLCDHLAGQPYCGEFCMLILKDVEADHVAFVDEPADRRCRVTSFSVSGGRRNKITWAITPDPSPGPFEEGRMEGIIATTGGGAQQPEDNQG
jgi:hypothetical protein